MPKPVLLLAFADPTRALRLAQEQRAVREALRDREGIDGRRGESRWELVERSNATLDDLRRAFADHRNRVVGFHYAGHGAGDRLLLESADGARADAHASGLAGFLGEHRARLQFVFLNACATGGQVEALLRAGVPAVIATSRAVRDDVAILLATAFYSALAGGAGLRRAFEEAQALVRAQVGDAARSAYRDLDVDDREPEADTWPWSMTVAPGAEAAEAWNLGAAVGDHALGLPPLPPGDLPPSPYRRLLPFTEREARVFFGRGAKIHALYDRLKDAASAPIVLLHGQSGAGKSSLVDAGLRPRLAAGFEVRYARRDPDAGLSGTLRAALGTDQALGAAWRMRSTAARPLVVILDQVEEAYTRAAAGDAHGGDAELAALAGDLAALFGDAGSRPPGKVLLAFRKEWLPEVEAPLAAARLFYAKEFLGRLDEDGVVEAVAGPAGIADYGLEIVDQEKLARRIAQDLLRDPDSPVAPTLQVLLSKMWVEATAGDPDVVAFDAALYRRMRDGAALGPFLDEQIAALGTAFPDAVASGLALDLLAFHTTPLATAQRREWSELTAAYPHVPALAAIVARCVDLSLLTDVARRRDVSGDASSDIGPRMLSHDTLAPLVRRLYDASVLPGQRARRVLESRAEEWADGAVGRTLDDTDLAMAEAGRGGMRGWTEAEERLVAASAARRRADEAERAASARAAVQRRRLAWAASGVVAVLGLAAVWQGASARRAAARARQAALVTAAVAQEDPVDGALLLATLDTNVALSNALQSIVAFAQRPMPRVVIEAGGEVRSAMMSRDERRVAAVVLGGSMAVVRVWSTDGTGGTQIGDSLQWVARNDPGGRLAALSPDAERVAIVGLQGHVEVWNADGTGTPTALDAGWGVMRVALDDDDARLVVWSQSGAPHEWRAARRGAPWVDAAAVVDTVDTLVAPTAVREPPRAGRRPPARRPVRGGPARVTPRGGVARPTVPPPLARPVAVRTAPQTSHASQTARAASDVDSTADARPLPGARLRLTTSGSQLLIWDTRGSPAALTLPGRASHVNAMTFGGRGGHLVTLGADGRVRVWAADGSAASRELTVLSDTAPPSVVRMAMSADETRVATLSDDDSLRVWSAEGGAAPRAVGRVERDSVTEIAFVRDGRALITVQRSGVAYRWSVDGAGPRSELRVAAPSTGARALSADGRRAAGVFVNQYAFRVPDSLRVWSIDGAERWSAEAENPGQYTPQSVALSPDASRVLVFGWTKRPMMWEVETGRRWPVAPSSHSTDAVFSPDGRLVAIAAGDEDVVRVFAADGSGERLVLPTRAVGDTASDITANAVAFSPDGRRLAVGNSAGTVRVFLVDQTALLAYMRRATTACLREPLRRTYLDESADAARAASVACERAHGRTPPDRQAPTP